MAAKFSPISYTLLQHRHPSLSTIELIRLTDDVISLYFVQVIVVIKMMKYTQSTESSKNRFWPHESTSSCLSTFLYTLLTKYQYFLSPQIIYKRYFQHAHHRPILGLGKRGAYYLLVHGGLARQHLFGAPVWNYLEVYLLYAGGVSALSTIIGARLCDDLINTDPMAYVWRFK